jgi:hypothetical protein
VPQSEVDIGRESSCQNCVKLEEHVRGLEARVADQSSQLTVIIAKAEEYQQQLQSLTAENAALRAALEPFVSVSFDGIYGFETLEPHRVEARKLLDKRTNEGS